jgi:hypothetical protein
MGFGAGLTSGQAMDSTHMRGLLGLVDGESAVCCVNIGTATRRHITKRLRPQPAEFCGELQDGPKHSHARHTQRERRDDCPSSSLEVFVCSADSSTE